MCPLHKTRRYFSVGPLQAYLRRFKMGKRTGVCWGINLYIFSKLNLYFLSRILNMNARNIILTLHINVSAKIYDTTKVTNKCSTPNGSCKLDLFFPITYYLVLTAPKNVRLSNYCYNSYHLIVYFFQCIFITVPKT